MGPFELIDAWRMSVAIIILERSLAKGKNSETIQFNTVRKFRSAFSNCWNSSEQVSNHSVMAKERSKVYVIDCPTYSLWFERFVRGMHNRMGDVRLPNAAIGGNLMREIMRLVNLDYFETFTSKKKRYYARAGLFFMSAYLSTLRGEEVPQTC